MITTLLTLLLSQSPQDEAARAAVAVALARQQGAKPADPFTPVNEVKKTAPPQVRKAAPVQRPFAQGRSTAQRTFAPSAASGSRPRPVPAPSRAVTYTPTTALFGGIGTVSCRT